MKAIRVGYHSPALVLPEEDKLGNEFDFLYYDIGATAIMVLW